MGPGVEPGIASAHELDTELFLRQVNVVHVGYFELSAPRRLYVLCYTDNVIVVKYRPVTA